MLIVPLFTKVKIWDESKCSSTDEWFKTLVYIHNQITFSLLALKNELNSAICDNMDLPGEHYDKWSRPDTEIKLLYNLICEMYNSEAYRGWEYNCGHQGLGKKGVWEVVSQSIQSFS